jgi:PUA domain protein
MMKKVRIDKGAIKHVLQGADIMTPGLTSKGGQLSTDLKKNDIVVNICQTS